MKLKIFLLVIVPFIFTNAQFEDRDTLVYQSFTWEESSLKFGAELDVLPYFNKGYDLSLWTSYYLFKVNFDWALKYPADFVTNVGFENLRYKTFGVQFSYFPIPHSLELDRLWFGLGMEKWSSKIQQSTTKAEAVFNNYLISVSVGYLLFVYGNWYVNPYLSGHLRAFGDKSVYVGGYLYNVQKFTPEISIKIGYHLKY